jgi:aspartate racemase
MKTIGLLGGMSWESSAEYYRIINQYMKQALGGLHSAQCLLYSVDFAEIEALQMRGAWDEAGVRLGDAAQRLERAGADMVLLCTNTMHKVAPAIQAAIAIPLLHIADPTAAAIVERGFRTVGLLGTRFTMEQDFYKGRLTQQHGLAVLVPPPEDQAVVHRIIYDELCLGRMLPESRRAYQAVIERLALAGAEAIILGCTEIGLLVQQEHSRVPLFDTTLLHAQAAAQLAIEQPGPAAPPLLNR